MAVSCIDLAQQTTPLENQNLQNPTFTTPSDEGFQPGSPLVEPSPSYPTGPTQTIPTPAPTIPVAAVDLVISEFKTTKESIDKVMIEFKTNKKAQCRSSLKSDSAFDSMTLINITGKFDHAHLYWGLSANTDYQFFIKCRDEDGIEKSTQTSSSTKIWTLPEKINKTIDTSSTMGSYLILDFVTEQQAECRIAASVQEFDKMRIFSTTRGTSQAVLVWGLDSEKEYIYDVLCRDNDGVDSSTFRIQFKAK